MTLDEDQCWVRLAEARHGVLGTVHPRRGVDAVPVVFAVARRSIVIPVDRVKPKRGTRLQRLANIEYDDRCVLLVEHYEEDWSRLWWVRVHALAAAASMTEELAAHFATLFPPYQAPGSIESVLTLVPTSVTGWSVGNQPEDGEWRQRDLGGVALPVEGVGLGPDDAGISHSAAPEEGGVGVEDLRPGPGTR